VNRAPRSGSALDITMRRIPFNRPYFTGRETDYIRQAFEMGKTSGNGTFTQRCHDFFIERYGFRKVLLTTSCTDALEMAALLLDIQPGDEVIMPSFTFVSTANAFLLRGARIVFVDSRRDHPGMDEDQIEPLITERTKAVVPVHYAGVACDMDKIMDIARRHDLLVVEDAAQAIDSYHTGVDGCRRPLGSIGHLGAFSFHETKNIISGEGGMLAVNDPRFVDRAEVLWEKGTNRAAFFRGEVNKYGWMDVGSSFLPADIIAACLWAQLESLEEIQQMRMRLWRQYWSELEECGGDQGIQLPHVPGYATNNAHMFYCVSRSAEESRRVLPALKERGIGAVFHYQSLHRSPFYADKHDGRELPETDRYSDCIIRLPFYCALEPDDLLWVSRSLRELLGTSGLAAGGPCLQPAHPMSSRT